MRDDAALLRRLAPADGRHALRRGLRHRADDDRGDRTPYDESASSDPDIIVFRIAGVFFFGAAATIGSVLDRISDSHKALIVDLSAVPFLDATAANMLEGLASKEATRHTLVYIVATSREIRDYLQRHGIDTPLVFHASSIEQARRDAHARILAGKQGAETG